MNELIPYVLAIVGGLLALFFKNRADSAKAESMLAEVARKDASLSAQQDEDEKKRKEIENQDDSKLTPEERAARWEK